MKVAVVGSGISGIGAAWLFSRQHEVHLFESEKRLGGHAHTVFITEDSGQRVPMDTGFLVYNELTYPHLTQFFKTLQVETVDSDMSLSIQIPSKKLEWSGTNLNSVFGQRKNIFNPSFYKMLSEVIRFGNEAPENLILAKHHQWSLADLLKVKKYSTGFCTDYLIPIGAAIWSTPENKMLDFPAQTFLTFFINHKLLQVRQRPVWRTVKNGSIQYLEKAAKGITHIHLDSAVVKVQRVDGKVKVSTKSGSDYFDKVVMATPAPITVNLLDGPSEQERNVLSSIRYEPNHAVLHSNSVVMPKVRNCWASWNVLGHNNLDKVEKVSLTYYLNRLQPLPTKKDYFVTLNPLQKLEGLIQEFEYAHPQFNQAAIDAQGQLPQIQGIGGIYYAGAWSRYGFHEDGLLSAVNVAKLMDVEIPWTVA